MALLAQPMYASEATFVQPNQTNVHLLNPAFHLTDDRFVTGFSGSFIELLSVVSDSERAEGGPPTLSGLAKCHQRYCAAHNPSRKLPRQDTELSMVMGRAERFDGRRVSPIFIYARK